jgi:hypothetical protein
VFTAQNTTQNDANKPAVIEAETPKDTAGDETPEEEPA